MNVLQQITPILLHTGANSGKSNLQNGIIVAQKHKKGIAITKRIQAKSSNIIASSKVLLSLFSFKINRKINAYSFIIALLTLCNSAPLNAKETFSSNLNPNGSIGNSEQNYIGTINKKLNVVFHIKNSNGLLEGFYYYEKIGVDIKLIGKQTGNTMALYELDYQNNKVAQIKAEIHSKSISGQWTNLKTNQTFALHLSLTSKPIPVLPKKLEGIYIPETKENQCNISFHVTKVKGDYRYQFQSDSRNKSGAVTFYRSLDENAVYIIFKGIKWAENLGDVSNEEDVVDSKRKEIKLPDEIEGLLSEEEITIQNTGNAMNYYVKLYDCDQKFIHLQKIKKPK
ncbi:hypothetical protein [Flavobacterium sp. GCM10023249]|uniref:hypothetical protein n=1 Tax=unclassified Flavobacterium TaxID=196869 RepID=UPI003615A018